MDNNINQETDFKRTRNRFVGLFAIPPTVIAVELIYRAEKRLNLPLPEMPFGNNSLVLTYSPGQEGEEVEMRFNGLDALAEVGVGEGWEDRTGGAVLVSMAETWGKNRSVLVLSDRTYGANGQNATQSITF
jgi:hypothetical protein